MKRKAFIKNSAITAFGISAFGIKNSFSNSMATADTFKVNSNRISNRLFELAKFGLDDKGRGYRVAYTKADIEGRAWFMDLMKKAGLNPIIDAAGNIIGKRKGKNASLKPIAFGSHIDMVPDGGNYDGTVGSIGALEIIEILNENNIITDHPLELIIFANEEGGTIGSIAMVGKITTEGLLQKSQSGLTMAEGIKAIGGNADNIESCIRNKGDLHAWLELHIEQGGILESEKLNIGVVEGIVGLRHWIVTLEGFANHAGTTPMNRRQDALLAASKFVIAVNEVVNSVEGNQVGTVGKMTLQPGAYNVIPGKVVLGLEIRDLSDDKIDMLFAQIEKRAAIIANESKVKVNFELQANASKPALTNKVLQQVIFNVSNDLGLTTKLMQSGAGHDSQEVASIAPSAMIFIPSVGGISHSPKEFSTILDIANGTNVLLKTILAIDKGIAGLEVDN